MNKRESVKPLHPVLRWLWYLPVAFWVCVWHASGFWNLTISALIPYLLFRSLVYYLLTFTLKAKGRTRIRIIILVMDLLLLPAFSWLPWT